MTNKKTKKAKAKKTTQLPPKLVEYLKKAGVNHKVLEHKTVYTAIDAANTMKRKLSEVGKSLFVKADKDYYIVIIPADANIDFKKLAEAIGQNFQKTVKVVRIPGEDIMEAALKIKKGTLSAFGKIHDLPVIVDKKLKKSKTAIFPTGSFNHSVEMKVSDFIKQEEAKEGEFAVKKKVKQQEATKPKKSVKPKTKKKVIKKK